MKLSGPSFQTSLLVTSLYSAIIWLPLSEAYTHLARWKRQSCSGTNSFKCKSGECISNFFVCDGEANCRDRSDETAELCKNTPCPEYAFRCKYGACVDSSAKCNRKKECADGSDEEAGCKTTETTSCKKNQFECSSGFCLDPFLLCDGTKDCDDGSDETKTVCGALKCPQYSFQCKYGACIDQDGKCNGIVQCADGSDETPELCGTTTTSTPAPPPAPTGKCVLPEQPANGEYVVGGCNKNSCPFKPGSEVNQGTIIRYTCEKDYKLSGSEILLCDPEWTSAFPTCAKVLCPALAMPSRLIECSLNGKNADCAQQMAPGTKASVRCNTWYDHVREFASFDTECRESGQWSRPVTPCIAKCGIRNPDGVPFIANGYKIKRGEFPWHAGIYQKQPDGKMRQVCGGSVVSPYSIVSAAHCFWDDDNKRQSDLANFKVLVGKHFLEWDKRPKKDDIQELDVIKVDMPERYKGRVQNYIHDIAVVNVNVEIHMTLTVRPVCVDYEKEFTNHFSPGKSGTVVGWGYTENNSQSDVLRAAPLPYIDYNVCEKEVPETFAPFLTYDKFCAGYRNGTSVCPGDSGGGFTTQFKDGRWYLMGVVSVGVPSITDECNIYQYTTFTKVSEYYDFVKEYAK